LFYCFSLASSLYPFFTYIPLNTAEYWNLSKWNSWEECERDGPPSAVQQSTIKGKEKDKNLVGQALKKKNKKQSLATPRHRS
jgi:hypothetical protein